MPAEPGAADSKSTAKVTDRQNKALLIIVVIFGFFITRLVFKGLRCHSKCPSPSEAHDGVDFQFNGLPRRTRDAAVARAQEPGAQAIRSTHYE